MSKNTRPTKAELVASLVAAGKGSASKLRRLPVAELQAMTAAEPTRAKKEKPTTEAALARVAGLLGLTLGEVKEMRAYSRAEATDADGRSFALYRNATNVGVVPKGCSRTDADGVLAEFQRVAGGTLRTNKAELLVPDEAVAS